MTTKLIDGDKAGGSPKGTKVFPSVIPFGQGKSKISLMNRRNAIELMIAMHLTSRDRFSQIYNIIALLHTRVAKPQSSSFILLSNCYKPHTDSF